jgi:subtilase family serine protease
MSWLRTDIAPRVSPAGYGPADLQSAYNLPSNTNGTGQVVAIVDAFDDPTAEADLANYRSTFGLPACTTANGCFIKVNQLGNASNYPAQNFGWELEISLDLDMVSAVCPKCDIILVEAKDNSRGNLYTAENTAANVCAANEISNSWGGGEYSGEDADDSTYFNHPGVMITFASGDGGTGPSFPPTSQFVTSVGGTTLMGGPGTWSETVWSGSGSGCSAIIHQPAWQTALGAQITGCTTRISNDVAAVADPGTPLAVYDSGNGGWLIVGGTSAATPIIGGVYALAGNGGSQTYGMSSYNNPGALHDILTGSNGSCSPSFICNAGAGFDGPTGNGTPNGVGGF